mmetsp:Transcript_11231/g.50963  ORF Transcript_11231/g.50963 Transcript_11231/m.50963 type:complete len:238 (+) Transcript_11231:1003-1716(+)
MGNKCETSIILFVQQRRWLRRVKYRGGCGVWVESSLPTHTHFASSTSSCLCASVKSARASSTSMVSTVVASPPSSSSSASSSTSSASPTVPSAGPDAPSPEPARSSSEASLAVSPSMSSRFSSDCGEAGAIPASSSGAMGSSANAGGATGGGSATAMSASMIVPWCTSEPGESSPPAFGDAATSGASSTTIASAASAGASFMSTSIARRGAGRSPTLAPWSTARLRARAPPPSLDGI